MDLIYLRITFVVLIFLTGLIGGRVPLKLGTSVAHQRFFSLGNAFAGGIFLGAGLIHMLPDATHYFGQFFGSDFNYPIAFCVAAVGFVFILLLEKVVLSGKESAVITEVSKSNQDPLFLAYILAVLLSVHSIIAGLALGAENSAVDSFAIFIAIVAHKGSASFALSVNLCRSDMKPERIMRIIAFFSCMTPLGIIAGAGISQLLTDRYEMLAEAFFDALACGTFLYITSLHIINEEFFNPKDKWLKFSFLASGLGLMALIAIWT